MKKIYLLLLTFSFVLICFSQSPIATIDRANITGPTATGVTANISALGFTRGPEIALGDNGVNFSTKNWNETSLAAAQAADEYIQWSISANPDYNIDISSLDIRLLRNTRGPQNWQILYSLDGFATTGLPLSSVQTANTTATDYNVISPTLNSGNNGTITFRLYAWNANNPAGILTIEGQSAWTGFGVTNPGVRISGLVNSSIPNSAESNIIATGFNPTDNINYLSYNVPSGLSTANALKIGEFLIQDGGNDLMDADILPTILTDITFNVTGASNIAALAIFQGTTKMSEITVVAESTTFSSINSGTGISAPDNGTRNFSVYATFKTVVTDNEQLQLNVTAALANGVTGSTFETANAGGASTPISADDNRIEVTRSRLIFGQQPSDVILFEIMTPAPTVLGVDINSNLDLDYNGDIVIGSTQLSIDGSSTTVVTASSGVAIFDNLAFSEVGVDNLTATAQDTGIIIGISTSFTVSMPAFDGLIYSSNAWSPSAPTNGTGSVNALVLNGTYTVTSDVAINNLIIDDAANVVVESGKSLQVNGDLTCNNNVLLDSNSLLYSSLIVNGNVSCNIVYSRHVNTNASVGGNDLISSPVSSSENFGEFAANNSNIFSNPSNPTEKLFGPYDKTTGLYLTYDTNIPSEAAAPIESGVGYRAASTDGLNFNFTGSVVLTDVTVPIVISGPFSPEWNLVGNPYPSYIKLSDFLAANNSQFATISSGVYGYDGNASDGWQIWNQAYSDANPDAVITPGQGFLVTSVAASGTILFTPAMRTNGTSDDFIPGRMQNPNISHLTLKLENSNNNQYKTDFYFTENASLGLDPGYDSQIFSGLSPELSIYSQLVEENTGVKMGVQSIGNLNLENVSIPLGVNAVQGQQVTISIDESTLPQSTAVFLEDNVTNIITQLTTSDYVFTPSSNIEGTGRFFLRFSEQSLSNEEFTINSLQIYATLSPKTLFIKGQLDDITNVEIFDIQGRLVLRSTLEAGNTNNQIDISNLKTGIYAVSVTNNSITKTKKIIIK